MPGGPFNVLFLCTGNSARSILAEAILNRLAAGRFRAWSAGSHPAGTVNAMALALLDERGYDIAELGSKSWHEFAGPSHRFDLVITVCDAAAAEQCPVWPGTPLVIHWGLPDPAAVDGDEDARRTAFEETYAALLLRLDHLVRLPVERLTRNDLERQLEEIGDD